MSILADGDLRDTEELIARHTSQGVWLLPIDLTGYERGLLTRVLPGAIAALKFVEEYGDIAASALEYHRSHLPDPNGENDEARAALHRLSRGEKGGDSGG